MTSSSISTRVLETLLFSGAHSPERAMLVEDLARNLDVQEAELEPAIEVLRQRGYIISVKGRTNRLYLSSSGILVASSQHS